MTDPNKVRDDTVRVRRDVESRLRQIPSVQACVAGGGVFPSKWIRCSAGHRLQEVTLAVSDHEMCLVPSSPIPSPSEISDGWGGLHPQLPTRENLEPITLERVKLKCTECRFTGITTQTQLLGLFAEALQSGKASIRLR